MRLPDDGDMAYGVSLDLLNQLLWVAWQTGDFDDPDLAGLLGREIPGLDVEIEALLPPVLRPGVGGATLGVDWGDVIVRGTVDPAELGLPNASVSGPISMEAHVSARVDFALAYDGATDALVVGSPTVDVHVQVVGSDAPIDEAAVGAAIESAISELVGLYADDIADAIPTTGEIDVSDVPGLPAGFTLGLEDAVVGVQDGYVTLSGTIR
jgi:hypothetical protein